MAKRDRKKELTRAIPHMLSQLALATAQSPEQAAAAQSVMQTSQDMMAADYQKALEEEEKKRGKAGKFQRIGSAIGSELGGPIGDVIGSTAGAQLGGADESVLQSALRTSGDRIMGYPANTLAKTMATQDQPVEKFQSQMDPEVAELEDQMMQDVMAEFEAMPPEQQTTFSDRLRGIAEDLFGAEARQGMVRELGAEAARAMEGPPPVSAARAHPMLDQRRAESLRGEVEARREREAAEAHRRDEMALRERTVATQEERTGLQAEGLKASARESEQRFDLDKQRLGLEERRLSTAEERHNLELKVIEEERDRSRKMDEYFPPEERAAIERQQAEIGIKRAEADIARIGAQIGLTNAQIRAVRSGSTGSISDRMSNVNSIVDNALVRATELAPRDIDGQHDRNTVVNSAYRQVRNLHEQGAISDEDFLGASAVFRGHLEALIGPSRTPGQTEVGAPEGGGVVDLSGLGVEAGPKPEEPREPREPREIGPLESAYREEFGPVAERLRNQLKYESGVIMEWLDWVAREIALAPLDILRSLKNARGLTNMENQKIDELMERYSVRPGRR